MVERAAPGSMPRPIERRVIDDPGAGMLARPNAGLAVGQVAWPNMKPWLGRSNDVLAFSEHGCERGA